LYTCVVNAKVLAAFLGHIGNTAGRLRRPYVSITCYVRFACADAHAKRT